MPTAAHFTSEAGIAVVGSGYWGKNLIRNFYNLGSLRLICDKSETLLSNFKEQYPEVDTCLSISEVVNREDITGIVIATPAEMHYAIAKEAILAGKHVFIEKPFVLDESEGRELIELAKKHGQILMVGHLLQYHPVFVKLLEMVSHGELGKINYIYSNRLNLGKIRREENILWSFAPHDISMILALAGEEPSDVYAVGGNFLHKQIADVTTTHLEFPSGLQAHIFVSWLHPFKEQKLVVVGDRKMAVFDDTKAWDGKLLLYPHEIGWSNEAPQVTRAQAEAVEVPQDEPLKLECQHFLDCMSSGSVPLTDGEEGLRVLKVLNAGQKELNKPGTSRNDSDSCFKESVFVHETAVVDENVCVGEDSKIWHFSHILPRTSLGRNVVIGQNVAVGPDVTVGNGCKVQNNVSIYRGVTLGDKVFCGPSVVFTNVHNPRAEIVRMGEIRPTLVREGASLGANSTIVCGNNIGRYAFVGAGAVVVDNVLDHALVVGNPAKRIGWMCRCGVQLDKALKCPTCDKAYQEGPGGLVEKA